MVTLKEIIYSSRFQKYFQNVSWLVFEKVFSLFVGMLVGIYVARYLMPEKFGMLNYAISLVGIFSAFSTMGLDQIVIRELAKNPDSKNELLGTSFALKVVGAFVTIILVIVALFVLDNGRLTNILVMIIAASEIFRAFEVINYFYQAKVLSKYVVQVQLWINFIISGLKISLVFLEAPLIWFAIIILIGTTFNAIGFVYAYHRNRETIMDWKFEKPISMILLRESWPLTLYGLALYVQARIDQVMLGKMLNNYEVGQYSVALKFIEIFGFVPMVLMSTFAPAVTNGKEISQEVYHNRLLNFYRLMFATFILTGIPIYFFAEHIIVFLYGSEYRAAGWLLSLFAIRLFFTNMGVGKSVFIVNESLFKYSLFTAIIGAISNIAINYLLIPHYASSGAIIATIISFTISIFFVDLFFRKARHNQILMCRGILTFWKLGEVFDKSEV